MFPRSYFAPSYFATSYFPAGVGDDCPPPEYHPRGREGIGIAQPPSGTDYPLVRPSEDVRYLFADFYLAYDEPADYTNDAEGIPFTLPFRIAWLYGFGCDSVTRSFGSQALETPTPTHTPDLLVVDADNRVVFDSTVAVFDAETAPQSGFAAREWGDRLYLYEWKTETAVCRAVVHTKWSPDDDPEPFDYPYEFEPDNATLDERAVERLPKRVRALTVVLDNLKRTGVIFAPGYNMALEASAARLQGRRHVTQIMFDAIPGKGLGIYPGCDTTPLYIRTINGQASTTVGKDFHWAAAGCYFARQPTELISTSPRITLPWIASAPYNNTDDALPDPLAGTTKEAAGWPLGDDKRYAHLQMGNDCGPCCSCEDYVAVATYMNTLRDRYHIIGQDAAAVRNQYHENRDRWLAARACILSRPLRLVLQPQLCPFLDIALQFCNQGNTCIEDLELSVTLAATGDGTGELVPGFTFITGASSRPGRTGTKTERYHMDGEWPTFTATWDAVQPGASANVRFRLRFAGCGGVDSEDGFVPFAVTGTLSGTAEDAPLGVTETATATLACPAGDDATFDATECTT